MSSARARQRQRDSCRLSFLLGRGTARFVCLTPQATQVLWKRRGANALRIARRKIQSMVEPREAIRANTGLRIAEFSIVYDDIQRGFAECFVEFGRSGGWCSFPWIHRTKASSDYERVQQQLQAGPLPTPHTVYSHSGISDAQVCRQREFDLSRRQTELTLSLSHFRSFHLRVCLSQGHAEECIFRGAVRQFQM